MTGEPPLEPSDASPASPEDAGSAWASRAPAALPEPTLFHDQTPGGGWLGRLRTLAQRVTTQAASRRRRRARAPESSAAPGLDAPVTTPDLPDAIVPFPRLVAEAAADIPLARPDASAPPAPSAAPTAEQATTGWGFGRPDLSALDTADTTSTAPPEPASLVEPAPAVLMPQLGLFASTPDPEPQPEPTPIVEVATAAPDDLDDAPPEDDRIDRPTPIPEPARLSVAALLAMLFSLVNWPEQPRYWNGYLAVLTGVVTLSMLMFVLAEPSPRWILLVASIATIAGMDGVLRATWRVPFERGDDTVPSLFLPALYVLAAPLLIEHNASGNLVTLWALLAGAGFAAIAVAEVLSVRTGSPLYPYARMVTTAGAYFTAFSLLGVANVLHVGLLPAVLATWFITAMLAIELVREGEVDPRETAVFAAVAGLVVAQARWLLFFLPLDGYPAGLALVLVFYLVTGVLHSYVLRQLNSTTATSYGLVTAIGLTLLAVARAAGVA